MKRKSSFYVSFIALLIMGLPSCNQHVAKKHHDQQNTAEARAEVMQVLQEQSACWSQGDLECYMAGYWKSDSLVFVGKSGLTYGWQQTLANYKRNYPDTAAMGKLTFDILEMRPLSAETMLVIGKWHLKRDIAAGDLQGHFSVVFKRFQDGWKIVADHSS